MGPDVNDSYKSLVASIENAKIMALDKYQDQIQKNLEDEIVKRYFYRKGLYSYYLNHDEAIMAATELLGNEGKHAGILK